VAIVASTEEGLLTIEQDFRTVREAVQEDWHIDSMGWEPALAALSRIEAEHDALQAIITNLKAALENTERVLHDWLTGRPQHIHELVAHELAAIRQVLKESGA
jgi:hypothetical protein